MPIEGRPLEFNREAQHEFASEAEWRADLTRYQRGDTCRYGDYEVKPKRDLNGWPHSHGWVVVKSGCNALPAATWSHSMDGACRLIDAYVAAGEESDVGARRFWALVRLFQHRTTPAQPASPESA